MFMRWLRNNNKIIIIMYCMFSAYCSWNFLVLGLLKIMFKNLMVWDFKWSLLSIWFGTNYKFFRKKTFCYPCSNSRPHKNITPFNIPPQKHKKNRYPYYEVRNHNLSRCFNVLISYFFFFLSFFWFNNNLPHIKVFLKM